MKLTPKKLVHMYEMLLKIRYFELKAKELKMRAKLSGGVHLYLGEEAIAVGVCASLRKDDYITSTHRGHGHCIAKGGDVNRMMAELMGKETGYCKGKGGSMHIADLDLGILGANGIVGGGLPISLGAGLSCKKRNTGQVVAAFFGCGASNQGSFHESLNMASVMHLPVIYVCENNEYAVSTHVSRSVPIKNISDRSISYGIPGVTVDGNDVEAVYQATQEAVTRARKGGGPTLIEGKTYRWEGHYVGDPCVYRSKEEVEKHKLKNDPVKRFREKLIKRDVLTEEAAREIEEKIEKLIDEAETFARESKVLPVDKVAEDVFA